jgi:hypothetical protein
MVAQRSRDPELTDEGARTICTAIASGGGDGSSDTKKHAIGHFHDGTALTINGQSLPTEDLLGVEIFSVGHWNGEPYTDEQIADLIKNTNELTAEGLLEPPAKIGHKDDQEFLEREGYPAAGWVTNLYRVGDKVMADVARVPAKIAALIKAKAYGNISSEIWRSFGKAPNGKSYKHVLKAIAFLGEEIPAVATLDDIVSLYGSTLGRHGGALTYASDKKADAVIKFTSKDHDLSEASTDQIADNIADEFEALAAKVKDGTKGKIGAPRMRSFLTETAAALRGLLKGNAAAHARTALKHSDTSRGGEPPWSEIEKDQLPAEAFAVATDDDKTKWVHPHHWVSGDEMFLHLGGLRAALKSGDHAAKAHLDQHASATGVGEYAKGANMEPKVIAKALGLAETASEADILAAVVANTEAATKFKKVSVASEFTTQAECEDKGGKWEDGSCKMPSDYAMREELVTLKAERATERATALVTQAITEKKVAPAQKAWATKFAKSNPEGFKEYLAATPAIFGGSKGTEATPPDPDGDARAALHRLALNAMQESKGDLDYPSALKIVTQNNPDVAKAAASARAATN